VLKTLGVLLPTSACERELEPVLSRGERQVFCSSVACWGSPSDPLRKIGISRQGCPVVHMRGLLTTAMQHYSTRPLTAVGDFS